MDLRLGMHVPTPTMSVELLAANNPRLLPSAITVPPVAGTNPTKSLVDARRSNFQAMPQIVLQFMNGTPSIPLVATSRAATPTNPSNTKNRFTTVLLRRRSIITSLCRISLRAEPSTNIAEPPMKIYLLHLSCFSSAGSTLKRARARFREFLLKIYLATCTSSNNYSPRCRGQPGFSNPSSAMLLHTQQFQQTSITKLFPKLT